MLPSNYVKTWRRRFLYPQLHTDSLGQVEFAVPSAERNNVALHGTCSRQEMRHGLIGRRGGTKDVMVQPNLSSLPSFGRPYGHCHAYQQHVARKGVVRLQFPSSTDASRWSEEGTAFFFRSPPNGAFGLLYCSLTA